MCEYVVKQVGVVRMVLLDLVIGEAEVTMSNQLHDSVKQRHDHAGLPYDFYRKL